MAAWVLLRPWPVPFSSSLWRVGSVGCTANAVAVVAVGWTTGGVKVSDWDTFKWRNCQNTFAAFIGKDPTARNLGFSRVGGRVVDELMVGGLSVKIYEKHCLGV